VGAFLQGGKAIRGLSLGHIRQGHRRLRLGVCIGVSDVIGALYLDDVAVCRSQEVLGVPCDLRHQAWTSRAADLLQAADS